MLLQSHRPAKTSDGSSFDFLDFFQRNFLDFFQRIFAPLGEFWTVTLWDFYSEKAINDRQSSAVEKYVWQYKISFSAGNDIRIRFEIKLDKSWIGNIIYIFS